MDFKNEKAKEITIKCNLIQNIATISEEITAELNKKAVLSDQQLKISEIKINKAIQQKELVTKRALRVLDNIMRFKMVNQRFQRLKKSSAICPELRKQQ